MFRRWDSDGTGSHGLELELILADGSVYPTRGRAVALDRQVDVTAGTVLARGVFPNPANVLRPGQYTKLRAAFETRKNALTVPQRAVQNVQGMQQIAVVRSDDTVDVRAVKVEARVGTVAVIGEGLKPGERVIVEGGDRVRPGQKVRIGSARRHRPTPEIGILLARFFINRPIVAMVIAVLTVLVGLSPRAAPHRCIEIAPPESC